MMKKISSYGLTAVLILAFAFSGCGGGNNDGNGPDGPWTKQLGTAGNDPSRGIAVDGGAIYIAGITGGGLDGNMNTGREDLFLVKYGLNGNKQWTRQLGTTSSEMGAKVAVDGGNIYVTGYTMGELDGNTNAGGEDLFLVKYDASGNKLWTRQLGTVSDDQGQGVVVDGGYIYVTGATKGGLDGNTNAGGEDLFLVKYDASGNKLWTRQLGTASDDQGQGVAVDGGGNIYVTGATRGGLDGNTNAGDVDLILVKYDSDGNKQWTRQLGTASGEMGAGVATDGGSNIYVTGATLGGLDGNTNAGEVDLILVKYDSAGIKQWTRQLGTASIEMGAGVATDGGGNIYVTGATLGGLDGNTNAGDADLILVKYDPSGIKHWTRQLGTASDDGGSDVAVDNSGNIFVTGSTEGGLDGNTNAGGVDAFLIKFNPMGIKQ
jgi:hypothetical protein